MRRVREDKYERTVIQTVLWAVFPGVLLCLPGCAVGPRYVRPQVPGAPAYKEIGPQYSESAHWQQAQPQDKENRGKWWRVYNDPKLNELEEQANSSNQEIAAATQSFLAARAIVREARSQYFPVLTTNPSIVNVRPSSGEFGGLQIGSSSASGLSVKSYTDYSLPFDASWEPDFWGRIRNSARSSVFAAQGSAADLETMRLSIEAELAVDYYELRAQDSLKELFDSTVLAYQDALHLTRAQQNAGLCSDEAVAQADAQLKSAQAQDTNLAIQRAQYEHAIAVLTGQHPSAFSLTPKPLTDVSASVPIGVPSDLLERRPDIAAAERSVAEANAAIGVARSAWFPAILLNASGGFGNSSATEWFTWPSRFWSVGPSLAETIFDAGLRRATVQQYRATYNQTVATYRQTVLTAFQQVEDNLASLRILSQVIDQQNSAVLAASRQLQEANVRYNAGLDPYLNVIVAQTALLNSQQAAVNFRMQRMVASVQLIKALGGGWSSTDLPTEKELRTNVRGF